MLLPLCLLKHLLLSAALSSSAFRAALTLSWDVKFKVDVLLCGQRLGCADDQCRWPHPGTSNAALRMHMEFGRVRWGS